MTAGEPCPACGTPRRAEAIFCHHCGASLTQSHSSLVATEGGEASRAPFEPAAVATLSPPTGDYAFCPRCGTAWVESAAFCFSCGFQRVTGAVGARTGLFGGSPVADPATRPPAGWERPATTEPPRGKARDPVAFVTLMVVTIHIYLYYWIYQTYKDVTTHSPGVTQISPGRAVGFLFIPLFNVIWALRLFGDIPRSVAELQSRHPLGEPTLNKALATGLVVAGWVLLFVGGYMLDWRVLIVGEPLFLAGFVLVQNALNQHWARHPVQATSAVAAK